MQIKQALYHSGAWFLMSLFILAFVNSTQAQSIACGSEAIVSKQRAQKLHHAVAMCQQYFAQGASMCNVKVDWKSNARLTVAEAARLADNLDQFTSRMEEIDRTLTSLYSRYEVNRRGTYVSESGLLKCQKSGVFLENDTTANCVVACYSDQSPRIADCWKEDIRIMGLCLLNEGGRLVACRKNCEP
jgi:hypothetical protein